MQQTNTRKAMTARDMTPAIGETVLVRFECLQVLCLIQDVKYVWGKARLLVMPHAGSGSQWVESARLVAIPFDESDGALEVIR